MTRKKADTANQRKITTSVHMLKNKPESRWKSIWEAANQPLPVAIASGILAAIVGAAAGK